MIYVLASAVISLLFGVLLLVLPPSFWGKLSQIFNRPVLAVDAKLRTLNFVAGFLLLVIGTWDLFLALQYPNLWQLHLLGVPLVIFGLLYIFAPNWIIWLSAVSDKIVITFDKIAIASRISLGIVLIMAAIYIFLRLVVLRF